MKKKKIMKKKNFFLYTMKNIKSNISNGINN
jgi:hypothetical protein